MESTQIGTIFGKPQLHRDPPVVKLKVMSMQGLRELRREYNPWPVHSRYFELYRMKTDRHWLRQEFVTHARAHGVKDYGADVRLLPQHRAQIVYRLNS
jgi:hypothetical protein